MPMIVLYVNFDKSKPKQAKRCTDAIAVLNELAPTYERNFMIFYTDDPA